MLEAAATCSTVELKSLYRHRFSTEQGREKARVWGVLVDEFFQKLVAPTDTVLDIGCGYGEFLNNVVAARRIGVDVNPDARDHLDEGIELTIGDVTNLSFLDDSSVDFAFTSNVLEHLQDKVAIEKLIAEVRRVLRNGGRFVLMGPNARLVSGAYWDFWDHRVPLTDRSLCEALVVAGFDVEESVAGFLPYSTRSRLPQWPFLVRAYLKTRVAWTFFGKQFLIVTHKR